MTAPSPVSASIIAQYSPVVCLDSKENSRPCDLFYYLNNSTPTDRRTGQSLPGTWKDYPSDPPNSVSLKYGTDTITATTTSISTDPPVNHNVYYVPKVPTGPPSAADMSAPVYYKASTVTINSRSVYEILYMFFWMNQVDYPYFGLGHHESDLEHIRVWIDVATGQLIRVYFGAHGGNVGEWAYPEACIYADTDRKRVMVYAARYSHATMRLPGIYFRIVGLFNDGNDGKGLMWNLANPNMQPYPDAAALNNIWQTGPGILIAQRQWFWTSEITSSSNRFNILFQTLISDASVKADLTTGGDVSPIGYTWQEWVSNRRFWFPNFLDLLIILCGIAFMMQVIVCA